jgi:hypothetical protein
MKDTMTFNRFITAILNKEVIQVISLCEIVWQDIDPSSYRTYSLKRLVELFNTHTFRLMPKELKAALKVYTAVVDRVNMVGQQNME